MAEEVTTAELARSLREYRNDWSKSMHDLRSDLTIQTGKLELSMQDMANRMSDSYVPQRLWEEVRKNQGERIGDLDRRLTSIEEKSHARYEACMAKIDVLDKEIEEKFDEKDKEAKADRRLIFTALVAPFIMLIAGVVLTIATGGTG